MKPKSIQIVFLIVVGVLTAVAQTGKIAGAITDKATHESLIGVNVIIKGTHWGAISDIEGKYFILNLPPGDYEITASLLGYQSVTTKNVKVDISRTTTIDFTLEQTTINLNQEVVINAERPDVVREKTSTSEILRADELILAPGIQDLTDVLTLSSDVVDGHFRGGREGEELYMLAGMGIVNPLTSSSAFAPIVSAIEEVEVVTSGFSAQYGNAQSGVINISMKEGQRDKWRGRAELRRRNPGYKFFGASPFDANANPYLRLLDSPEGWRGLDTSGSGTGGGTYYSSLGGSFSTQYGKGTAGDSVQASQLAYQLWKQARRDYNRPFDNLIDYSVDINLGGPLSENVTMFLASHVENTWLIVPTPEPDMKRQVMGNIVYDLSNGMSLRFSGAYTNSKEHLLPGLGSSSYTGFLRWLWDRVNGVANSNENNLQLGVRFSHALSNATFYEIKINRLQTDYADGVKIMDPNRYISDDQKIAVWPVYSIMDKLDVGHPDNDFRSEKTGTITFDGSITSQVTNSHLLLGGIQYNRYTIDVNNQTSLSDPGSAISEKYNANPFELGVYMQDKMEFEGMIANVGLRLDLFNPNDKYYTDIYAPSTSTQKTTPTVGRLQPRIGISFPVSISTVFHLNYGTFVQRPSFNRILLSQVKAGDNSPVQLGNPELKPEDTKSYDVGFTQGLGEGFTLDVSGYYKDVKNLIQQAIFKIHSQAEQGYRAYLNRDYADIRGFHVTLKNRLGIFTGKISYTYGVATGSNSTPFNTIPVFVREPAEGTPSVYLPNPKDVTMDFDRTHNLVLTLGISTPDEWGPELFGGNTFENISLSATSFGRSGRPYTSALDNGLLYGHRAPAEYNTKVKISKKISRFFGTTATFYAEVNNLFDQRIYSYNTVFQSASTTGSSSSLPNENSKIFDQNPDNLRYFTGYPPFLVDQTFLLYANNPREIYIGIILNF